MKQARFIKRVGVNVCLRFIAAALNLSLHILLARYLSQNDYGQYVFFVTVLFISSQACSLGFDGAGVKFYQQFKAEGAHGHARGFFLTALAIIIVTSILISSFWVVIYTLAYPGTDGGEVFVLTVLCVLSFGVLKNIQSLLNSYKQFYVYSIPGLLIRPFSMISLFMICGYLLRDPIDAYYLLYLMCFSTITATIFGLLFSCRILNTPIPSRVRFDLKNWSLASLPFLGSLSVRLIYKRFDIVMLGILAGNSYVAVYSVANRVFELLYYVYNTFDGIAGPVFAETYYKQQIRKLKEYYTLYSKLLKIAVLTMGCGAILGAQPMLKLFGPSYAESPYVLIIFIATLMTSSIFGLPASLLSVTGQQGYLFRVNLAGLMVNIILNLLLIPQLNVYGAAFATFVSINLAFFLLHRQAERFLSDLPDYQR